MKEKYSPYEMEYMTRDEAREGIEKFGRAILPFGATEQHGPHLPLGTDTFLAHNLSVRLAERIEALVLPAIPIGYSYAWEDIPGTLTLEMDVVQEIVGDIARSLENHGLEELIIVNGHGANDAAMKYAVRELGYELDMKIFFFTYPDLRRIARDAQSPLWQGMVHACEVETSWLLAVRPDLCRMEKAVREYPEGKKVLDYRHSDLPLGELSKSGVFGDATKASAERGEEMLKEFVDYMEKVITERE